MRALECRFMMHDRMPTGEQKTQGQLRAQRSTAAAAGTLPPPTATTGGKRQQPCGTERAPWQSLSCEPTRAHARQLVRQSGRPQPGAEARDWQSKTQPVGSMNVCITNITAATWSVSCPCIGDVGTLEAELDLDDVGVADPSSWMQSLGSETYLLAAFASLRLLFPGSKIPSRNCDDDVSTSGPLISRASASLRGANVRG